MSFLAKRRKSRETIGVTSVLALMLSPLVAVAAAGPAAADDPEPEVVFSTSFDDESYAPWTQSGNPELSFVDDGDGGRALSITRTADYESIQSPTGIFEAEETYTLSMRARLPEGESGPVDVRFVTKPEYTWVGNIQLTSDEWTEISSTYTIPVGGDPAQSQVFIGVGPYPDVEDEMTVIIDDILITKPAAGPVTLLNSDFEGSDLAPWQARGDDVTIEIVDTDGHDSDQSLLVANRSDGWHGVQTPINSLLEAGPTYQISAWVKLAEDLDDVTMKFTVAEQPQDWVGVTPDTPVTADEWVQISGTYVRGAEVTAGDLYIEASDPDVSFLVDDVLVLGPAGAVIVEPMRMEFDFEDGTLQGWTPRANEAGPATVDVTDAEAFESTYAAIVTDRVHQGQGIGYEVTDDFQPGVTYDISARVKFAEGQEPGNVALTLESSSGGSNPSYGTVGTFEGMSNSQWVEVTGALTMPTADFGYIYFETEWADGEAGNTSTFLVDDVVFEARVPGAIQDLTPLKETVPFPMGIAIDSRETLGQPSELLLKHFNQITPENHMKPEAFYTGPWQFQIHPQAIEMMDFAQANDIGVYGHVLVWHSQTPDWFYQDEEGQFLTSSEADKQIMRDRMRTHIFNVAEGFHDLYGPYGSDTNPFVAWDVINEVVDDSTNYEDGLRRSRWYQILGEEFIHLSFEYADEAFNDVYAAEGSDRPITLYINDYNTEQVSKQNQYLALVERLVENEDAPIDGVGHQFHVSVAQPTATLEAAIQRFQGLGLTQAVTELDVTLLTDNAAQIVEQGHYYKRAFDIFRTYADDLSAVTVWGLNDGRSWRSSGKPLLFDDSLQAKPAYYGASGGEGLPPLIRTANVFAADISSATTPPGDLEWDKLRLHDIGTEAAFQLRWSPSQLTAYVEVADATADAYDAITFEYAGQTVTFNRDGSGDVDGVVVENADGYSAVVDLPLATAPAQGSTLEFDARVTDGGETAGWNSPGELGILSLVESLSYLEVPQTINAPVIDGEIDRDWYAANVVTTAKTVEGTSSGAKAEVRTLWQGQTLYVLMDITDPVVDTSHSDPWAQDSVEIYVDGGNFKAGGFRYDDTQIRINADNVVSFGTGDEGFQRNRLQSATKRTETGWLVEASIDLLSYSGLGTFHGLDFQVNDGAPSSNRLAIHNWADPTGTGYQSTTRWGVGQLVEPQEIVEPEEPGTPDPEAVAPKITVQPQNVQAKAAKVVTLRAAASGTPAPTVQWQRRAPGKSTWSNIAGATTPTLEVKNTKGRSGSAYRAVFTNTAGTATTRAAVVRVKPIKAKVTQHPKAAKNVRPGKKVTLRAKATGAFPKASVQWQQRKPGKKWKNIKGATKRKLTVVASHKTHKVRYRAVFSNKAGKVRTKAARITVRAAKPVFVTQPKHARVKVGKAATFTAEVAARPKAKLQWFRRSAGATTWTAVPKGNGARKATLRVPRSQVRTGDQYVLIATNSKGWTASKMVRITVRR